MADVWIVVADSSEARIYAARNPRSELELLDTLTHAASRMHPRDLVSDAPGRVHDRFGPGRHSLDQGQQLKHTEKERFAREIAARLTEAHRQKKFDRLVIMAGPAFLGILRACFDKSVAQTVIAEISKDLIAQDVAAIRAHLP